MPSSSSGLSLALKLPELQMTHMNSLHSQPSVYQYYLSYHLSLSKRGFYLRPQHQV